MATRVDIPRIRCKIDLSEKTGTLVDTISGGNFNYPRGSDQRWEFGLFFGEELADTSLLTTARLRLRTTGDPDAPSLAVDKSIGVTSMNSGITLAQWNAGEPSHAHLAFEFTAAELAESVYGTPEPSDSGQQHWLLLTHGATDRHLFGGVVTSFDAGHDASGNAPPSSPTNISKEEVQALFAALAAQFVKYRGNPAGATIELTSGSTGKLIKIGADDEGNIVNLTQPTN